MFAHGADVRHGAATAIIGGWSTEATSPSRVDRGVGRVDTRVVAGELPSLPARAGSGAGPVPDRMSIWPVDDGRYGLDATFQGATGYERATWHLSSLSARGVRHTLRQELGGGWTVRFAPLRAVDVAGALAAFVR